MGKIYTNDNLRTIFQSSFQLGTWQALLKDFFHSKELRVQPEFIGGGRDNESGFYLGALDTEDNYRIGLFWYEITKGSVVHKKVGLRQLVKSFINPSWGEFDAALAVFSEGNHWRLSLICDIKEEAMSPRRFTYVFGEKNNYYNTPVARFEFLQKNGITFENLKNAFSVEALTKQFYNELFDWYQWAVKDETGVTFPNNAAIEDDDREQIDTKIIRLITRLMFVWFIKQKDLVPAKLFDPNQMRKVIKDFNPQSKTSGTYYNAILQNLFFATLNRAIVDEEGNKRCFDKTVGKGVKTTYRYSELFSISEQEVISLFSGVPFLNGGLFECLDKTKTIDGVEKAYYFDGFSRNDRRFADGRYKYRAFIPNNLFFDPEYGLFSILNRYNFTIEENTPNEQQVALDPELLGKVFENLLGAYNPETKETARNQSGSFYTPREVVNYMVDESLVSYLGDSELVRSLLDDGFVYENGNADKYNRIAAKLKAIKILDPACGSGAFPMGLLNRIVDILQKISPETSLYQLKLDLIENCIYGIDIQSIAVQISKLRFFISLICDCEKDASKPNFGIPTLPNLETKFVCANSLIDKKTEDSQGNLFEDPRIQETKDKLISLRNEHFLAKSASQKRRLREKDDELRKFLADLLAENDMASRADAEQMARWNPYDQNASSEFFSAEWMFNVKDGFDIVIGNPPYIQLQNNGGELGKLYAPCGYQSFASTGDIYCLFYERGWQLLKKAGHLCYITSNKWMRAGYGEKLRTFLASKTNPQLLIDFGGVKVFESATVDTNILLFEKGANEHNTRCAITNKHNKDSLKQLSVFVQQQGTFCDFPGGDSWVILSPIEQSIKRKIEAVGTPLKDWDIQINYGIKTGFNDAFIITSEKRDEILANCATEDERKRTDELIRPILRGRDIKRYSYDWANLWLIWVPWHFPLHKDNSIQGASDRAEGAFSEQYSAVYKHLLQYKPQLAARNKAETGIRYEWYALQRWGANYWEEFSKPKIIYPNMTKYLPFVYDTNCFYTNQKCFIITGEHMAFLNAFLSSPIFKYCFKDCFPELQGGTRELSKIFFDKIPVLKVSDDINEWFNSAVEDIQQYYTPQKEQKINRRIYDMYNLSEVDIRTIERFDTKQITVPHPISLPF